MALEYILIFVMTVELLVVILSVIEGYHECSALSEWSADATGPVTAMFALAETSDPLYYRNDERIFIFD